MWILRIHAIYKTDMEHICDICVTNALEICDEFVQISHEFFTCVTNTKGEKYSSVVPLPDPGKKPCVFCVFFIVTKTYRMPNGYD